MISIVDVILSILFINTVLLAIGFIIFGIACMRERELFSYLPIYLMFLIGNVFTLNLFVDYTYRIVGMVFFIASALSLFIAAFLDYYKIYIKSDLKKAHLSNSTLAAVVISPLVVTMQIFMMLILITASIMLLRVYLKTRSTVKLLFMTCGMAAVTSQIIQTIPYFDLEFALFLAYAIGTVYITILLINGIVAILEQEIRKTMKIKNSLKDSYSHNLGNILHTISISYELIMSNGISEKELNNLHHLLKDKIKEASELVKEIRKL